MMEDRNAPVTGYPVHNYNAAYSIDQPPSAAATYPHTAAGHPPLPYPHYHQQYYQPDPESVRRANCLRRILAFVIGLFLIFSVISFITWLVLHPQMPEFRVDSFSLSNITFTNDYRAILNSEIHLTARNPNDKMKLVYNHMDTVIYYGIESLSETTLPPFSQEVKNEKTLVVLFTGNGSFVDKWAVDAINGDIAKNRNVEFNLRMVSLVRFEANSWQSANYVKVFCGGLMVGVPSNGSSGGLTGGSRRCRVGI